MSRTNELQVAVRKRFPEFSAILQVYAVIVVLLSAWTITAFLWKLSAWLLILNLGEIFTIFSYAMLIDLMESLIVLFILLLVAALLPPHILRDQFVVRGTILALGFIGSLMAFVRFHMQFGIESGPRLLLGPIAVILLTALLLGFSSKIRFIASLTVWISDRLTVFLFILVPLFVLLSAYIIFRNVV
jgi:hypothetical protein